MMGQDGSDSGTAVVICLPAGHHIHAAHGYDLAQLVGFTASRFVQPGAISHLGIMQARGVLVAPARQKLAEQALEAGADFTFWLDSDMRFPPDALIRLLMHEEPFVAANYPRRSIPPKFTAVRTMPTADSPGEIMRTDPDSTGLEQAAAVGLGCALIHRSVFERLPDPAGPAGPWFQNPWSDSLETFVGEDIHFCKQVNEAGVSIMVDHDLSRSISHLGTFAYTADHAIAFDMPEEED